MPTKDMLADESYRCDGGNAHPSGLTLFAATVGYLAFCADCRWLRTERLIERSHHKQPR
jgi:hypothetical protein